MSIFARMEVDYHFFNFEGARLGYNKSGTGRSALLAFHGFGQDHTSFYAINEALAEHYTIYSFDLFFHGKSEWPFGDHPLTKNQWNRIITRFLSDQDINRFSLMGYSLGGKFVLATLETLSPRVDSVFFLAPDGIQLNFWYRLATGTRPMRALLKSIIDRPGLFTGTARWATRIGLVDKGIARFANTQMDSTEKRQQVYLSWVVFRWLAFNMKHIARLINARPIDTRFFIGRFDKMITEKTIAPLHLKLKNSKLKILESGHTALISQTAKEFRNIASEKT